MSEPRPITCSDCGGEVASGILYCWRHPASPPKVGELVEDHGQILWRSTGRSSGRRERSIAVLLDGIQVQVRTADVATHARPARLNLEIGNPSNAAAAATAVYIPLAALLDAFLAGIEHVEATRHT